jgi:hypothetical protein
MVGEAERWGWYGRIALNPDNLMIALHVKSFMSDTQALCSNTSSRHKLKVYNNVSTRRL